MPDPGVAGTPTRKITHAQDMCMWKSLRISTSHAMRGQLGRRRRHNNRKLLGYLCVLGVMAQGRQRVSGLLSESVA